MQLLSLVVHSISDQILKETLLCKRAQIEAAKFHAIMVFPGGPVPKRDAFCRARTPTALLEIIAAFIVRPDNTWVATADRKNSEFIDTIVGGADYNQYNLHFGLWYSA